MSPRDHKGKPKHPRHVAWWDMLLGALLLCGLVAAGAAVWPRLQAEQTQGHIEIIVDWASVEAVSQGTGVSIDAVLASLRAAGAVSIALPETTVADAAETGRIMVWRGPDMIGLPAGEWPVWLARLRGEVEGQVWPEALEPVYVAWQPSVTPDWLDAALANRLEHFGRKLFEADGMQVWTVGATEVRLGATLTAQNGGDATASRLHRPGALLSVGLGFDPDRLRQIQASGLRVSPRPLDAPGIDAESLDARIIATLAPFRPLGTVVFAGDRLPGGTALVSRWASALATLQTHPALIEFSPQRGLAELAIELDERAVRLHSIQAGELRSLSQEKLMARWLRAVRERGIRALYVRLYTELPDDRSLFEAPPDLLAYNIAYVADMVAYLKASGFEVGPTEPLTWPGRPDVRGWMALAMFGAIGASAMGLLRRFARLPWWVEGGVVAALAGGLMVALGAGVEPLARQLGALAAAIVIPTLATLCALDGVAGRPQSTRGNSPFVAGLVALAFASVVSLFGALLVAGLLADPRFMLGINTFVGVKAMHIVPPLAVAGAVVWQGPVRTWRAAGRRVETLLWKRIPVLYLLLLGCVAGIAVVTVLRTGNDGLPVAVLEDWLRHGLERLFGIRPRNKEFLFGHPMLVVLAGLLAHGVRRLGNGLTALLAAMASVGQLSMVNTFAHIHTPLLVSLARTAYGLILGALFGCALLGIATWGLGLGVQPRRHVDQPGESS